MTDKKQALDKLQSFRKRDKFSDAAWNERGLNPSNSEMCRRLENLFNQCVDNLITAINSGASPRQLKKLLRDGLSNFNRSDYDTEEKEFICDYFDELSKIVFVDFKDDLNSWLYGKIFNALFKLISFFKGAEKIVDTLSQDCTDCQAKLETFVIHKQEGIPDTTWFIVQCNSCNEYNLLTLAPNIKQLRYGNYKVVENLEKNEFNEEQARIRLEQIKFFRKK